MENLAQFKEQLSKASLEELYKEKEKFETALSQMVFDGTLILKLTFIEEAIAKKEK